MTICSWLTSLLTPSQGHDNSQSEVHEYIRRVLESGDHGPYRVLDCGAEALNDALEKHAERIAELIKHEFKEAINDEVGAPDDSKVTVHNYLGNIKFRCYVHTPKTLLEIVDLFRQARAENLKIRAVGAFHSWSPICVTDGYLIQTTYLTGTTPTNVDILKDPASAANYYDVLSGTTLQDAAVKLEKYGRALINMGGYSGLHMVGISCTGAHGSGLKIPPLAGMIRSVTVVSANFAPNGLPIVYRIEPTNGITDPTKPLPDVTLVQDDATFNAIIVGLGAFGVVYSVIIETVPFYWIKETRESVEWSVALQRLQQGPDGDILKYHNPEIWLNPYTSRALITKRELVTTSPSNPSTPNTNPFVTFFHAIPALEKIWKSISASGGPLDDLYRALGKFIGILLKHLPLLVPAALSIALETQNHPDPVFAKYYDIYDVGFASRFPVICCEITYPMNTYIAGVDAALVGLQMERKKNIHKAIVGWMTVRFTSSTLATLSMGYNEDSSPSGGRSYLEIFSLSDFYSSLQIYDDIVKPIQEKSIGAYLARHHWGQYMTPNFKAEQYKAKDPKFAANIKAVRNIADKYDPDHMMTNSFLNDVVFTT